MKKKIDESRFKKVESVPIFGLNLFQSLNDLR